MLLCKLWHQKLRTSSCARLTPDMLHTAGRRHQRAGPLGERPDASGQVHGPGQRWRVGVHYQPRGS